MNELKASYNKPIFDHTHEINDHHITRSDGQLFCLKCAAYCMIIPINIVPEWIRLGKRKSPFSKALSYGNIPEM